MTSEVPTSLDKNSLHRAAKTLARRDDAMADALAIGGPPKLWKRPANFATFVRIILEQQVSLASAWNTYERLRTRCPGGRVNAKTVAEWEEADLRTVGFSRQKARYTRTLADDCLAGRFKIRPLAGLPDDEVQDQIVSRLGLGRWSADIYLMLALTRPDRFPVGDLAIVRGYEMLTGEGLPPDELERAAERWRPLRSVAARLLWGVYLHRKGTTLPPGAFNS